MGPRYLLPFLLLTLGLVLGGCSEERYGILYCPGPADTLVVYPRLEFQQVMVISDTTATADHGPGMAGMETLYLGSSGETQSDILVNFDFSDVISDDYPDSMFEESNIKSVKLALKRLRPYWVTDDSSSSSTVGIFYLVRALVQPFDSNDYTTWPGPVPLRDNLILNSDFTELNASDEPLIKLYPENLSDWVRNRETVGMVISAAEGSDEGLVGFASRELTQYNELPPLGVGTSVAPTIVVEFRNPYIDNRYIQIPPRNDTSTFESVASLPPEMAHVQTGLRSYPVLTFDIPPLSDRTCVFDMIFSISEEELDPMVQGENLSVFYLNATAGDWSNGPILDEDLSTAIADYTPPFVTPHYPIPEVVRIMFNYEIRNYWKSNLYFSQSTFYGPSAAPELRPSLLLITGQREE